MKSNILKKIAHFQVEHPYLTIAIVLAITVFLYGGVSAVKTVASLELMMPAEISEVKAFNELRDNNLGQDMIGVVIEVNRDSTDPNGITDVRSFETFKFIKQLSNLISSNTDIRQTYSIVDTVNFAAMQVGINPNEISEKQYYQIINHPDLKEQISQFINLDYTTSVIIASTDVSGNDARMKLLASKLVEDLDSVGHPSGLQVKITGTPIIQQQLGVLIAKDRQTTQWLSTALVFLITMILFGTFTSALVPILIVTLSVNWLYGIMGYGNLPISTLAGGVAAMVIGIGIDYSIHLMNKFKNERKKHKSIKESVELAVGEVGTALSGAAIATILAFLAFLLGSMPEMNRFGLLMSIGVGASFLLSIFGLPAFLIVEEKIIHKLRKKMKFGVEGDLRLYEKDEVHPDDLDIYQPNEEELKTIAKKYKICKVGRKTK